MTENWLSKILLTKLSNAGFDEQHAMQLHSSWLYLITTPYSPDQPSFSLPPARARLSLVRIEYLYSRRHGGGSLISKVTCWSSVGGVGAEGSAWDGITWDILSPQCVLLFHLGKGLCFMVEGLPQEPRRIVNELLEWVSNGHTVIWLISKNTSSLSIKKLIWDLKIEVTLLAHTNWTSCTE